MAQFTLALNASSGTSNLNHLLGSDLHEMLSLLTPGSVEAVFGPGDVSWYEPERGYDAPEWYWQSSDGSVWGIGWRWGFPRLRGRVPKQSFQNGPFWTTRPAKEAAAEFVKFLCSS